jgi:hypothetical protein
MEGTGQSASRGWTTYDLDFTSIETGRLLVLEASPNDSSPDEEGIALHIRDTGGHVTVVGHVFVTATITPCGATLNILSSHSASHAESLLLSVSLLSFLDDSYEPLGSDEVPAGEDRSSQFTTRLETNDARIGEGGEIRAKLTVSPVGSHSADGGYVYAISEVSLELQQARDDGSTPLITDLGQAIVLTEPAREYPSPPLRGSWERQSEHDENEYTADDL